MPTKPRQNSKLGGPGFVSSQELELRLCVGQQLLDLLLLGAERQQLLPHHLDIVSHHENVTRMQHLRFERGISTF